MIDKWLNSIDRLNPRNLFWGIVTASMLLAAWMQYIQHGWINPDSLIYFEQARLFVLGQWKNMFELYQWPLYGMFIGITHKVTPLNIQASAQLLNMLFFSIATASFLQLIKLAGGNNRTVFMGMLLLFSSQYIVGDVLEMLMRDEGFWAFYLSAMVFFIRYVQQQKLRDAIFWQLLIIIATLFRIEAILFLLFLPLTQLFNQPATAKGKLKCLLSSYSVSILITIVMTIVISTQPQISMAQLGRLNEVFTSNLYHQFTQLFMNKADIMSHQVLGKHLDEFAVPGLLLTFTYIIGSKILTATGLIGTGLATLGFKYSSKEIQPVVKRVLITAACIALISMALIIIKVFVLSSRYVVALAWVLLIFASFYLSNLSSSADKKLRIIFIVICFILGLSFIKNILPKRDGYNYRQDAAAWIKQYNTDNSPVFFDDTRMVYFTSGKYKAGLADNWHVTLSAIENKSIQKYNIIVISHSKKNSDRLAFINKKLPNFEEIQRFNNYKSKKFIIIYRKKEPKNSLLQPTLYRIAYIDSITIHSGSKKLNLVNTFLYLGGTK